MQLSLQADYAFRTLMFLTGKPFASIHEISEAYGISYHHLVKVVHRLGQAGYLKTTRGKGGGISLGRPPEKIRLSDVFCDMEPSLDLVECFNSSTNTCRIAPGCGLKHVLKKANQAFMATLENYSLSDITSNQKQLGKLLGVK